MNKVEIQLDIRKGSILRAVVDGYVETGDPIGSEWLAARHDFGCRSATLRNEMADMADHGLLVQPHTSAGRIPSDLGYRYYVDRLMAFSAKPQAPVTDVAPIDQADSTVDTIIQSTCRILSDMTQYPSVATPPVADSVLLHRIYITPADARRVLVVMLLSSGHVENKLVELEASFSETVLHRLTHAFNELLAGRDLAAVSVTAADQAMAENSAESAAAVRIMACIAAAAAALQSKRMFVEGTSHLLREREFHNVLRLERLLTVLEQKSMLYEVVSKLTSGASVTVVIGTESAIPAMQDCSVVATEYRIGDKFSGFIGVFGPTRMRYDRAVTCVEAMAKHLSTVLTQTRLG